MKVWNKMKSINNGNTSGLSLLKKLRGNEIPHFGPVFYADDCLHQRGPNKRH